MKAAKYYGKEDLRIEEVEEDDMGPNDVRIEVEACGICGTDLHEYAAGPIMIPETPVRFGHEFGGTIIEVGAEVSALEAGDNVSVNPIRPCNECTYCEQGLGNLCDRPVYIGFTSSVGGFAERIAVAAGAAHKMPDEVPVKYASLIEPLANGYYATTVGEVGAGDTAVVFGAGPIGQSIILCLNAAGATVVLVEPLEARREIAADIGVDLMVDPTETDPVERINEFTDGGGDVTFEVAGVEAAFEAALAVTKKRGTLTHVALAEEEYSILPNPLTMQEISLKGVWGYPVAPQSGRSEHFERVLNMIASGKIDPDPLVTSRIGLDDIDQGFQALGEEKTDVKILVKP
ncbi:2,3-butanediol dehydrogenase [Salinibaculum salinum]|uniref:2,3-butanediol dehydrogenase n=1 Tax=Salinibaculum salinum TaxID=3131996 RepID=UPI0030ECD223